MSSASVLETRRRYVVNMRSLSLSRTLSACMCGIVSGILRVEGLVLGLGTFILYTLLSNLVLFFLRIPASNKKDSSDDDSLTNRCSFFTIPKSISQQHSEHSSSTPPSTNMDTLKDIFVYNMFSGLLTYILTWTLVYDVLHVF